MRKDNNSVRIILRSAAKNRILTLGTLFAVVATIVTALLPPLVLERAHGRKSSGSRTDFRVFRLHSGIGHCGIRA